jgi:hypothetical protein
MWRIDADVWRLADCYLFSGIDSRLAETADGKIYLTAQ